MYETAQSAIGRAGAQLTKAALIKLGPSVDCYEHRYSHFCVACGGCGVMSERKHSRRYVDTQDGSTARSHDTSP